MFCPQCRSEFVSGITECGRCKVPLVNDLKGAELSDEDVEKHFAGKEVELVSSGHMAVMREVQTVLETHGIPSRIVPFEDSNIDDNMHARFRLEVIKEDSERLKKLSSEKWKEILRAEGLDAKEAKEAVVAAGAETECPACGTKFTPANPDTAECPDCGLFLGAGA